MTTQQETDPIAVDLDQYVIVPGLTASGYPSPQRVDADGKIMYASGGKRCNLSPSGYPIPKVEYDACIEWIAQFCKPRKTPNRFRSYALKHIVERYYREIGQRERSYISNGAFIAAAIASGYEPIDINGPNAGFAMWIHVDGFKGSSDYLNGRRPTKGYI